MSQCCFESPWSPWLRVVYYIKSKQAGGWALDGRLTVRGPVGCELLVVVVVHPRYKGEDCDGCGSGHSQNSNRPPGENTRNIQLKRKYKWFCFKLIRKYLPNLPEWRHNRSQITVSTSPENSLEEKRGKKVVTAGFAIKNISLRLTY